MSTFPALSHWKDKWVIRSDAIHRQYEDTACKGCSPKYDSGQDGLDPILSKQTAARQKQGSRYFRGRNGIRKNLAGSFCFGFAISEDTKKWGRKVNWLIKDLENCVRELADYPGKGKMRRFKRKQYSSVCRLGAQASLLILGSQVN